MKRTFALAATVALLATAPLQSQVIYGTDSAAAITWEFTSLPGGACGAPTPFIVPCPNAALICPGVPPPAPVPAGLLWGDIADDPITDTVYITDGLVVLAHAGDPACGFLAPPCAPLNAFLVPPTFPPMGPITGLGCDSSGTFSGGAPMLWMTDGAFLAGILPPPVGACVPAAVLFPPCPLPPAVVPATDVSWDPAAGLLWVVGAGGLVQPLVAPGCAAAAPPLPVLACGLGLPLTGMEYDTTTPGITGAAPAAYVTDGAVVARIDLTTGGPAAPTFASPLPCTPAPAPLSGLSHALHGITYGGPLGGPTLTSFGQSTTPGPSFGLQLTGAPPGSIAFLIRSFSLPGPGFLCPPLFGVGVPFWVDPTLPGSIVALPAIPAGPPCIGFPVPIPAGLPVGVQVFAQVVYMPPAGLIAIGSTPAMAITIGLP